MKIIGAVSPAGWRAVSRMVVVLAVSLLLGLIVGRVALVLSIVLAIGLGMQLWNLFRLEHWLRRKMD